MKCILMSIVLLLGVASAPAGVKFPEFRADGAGAAKLKAVETIVKDAADHPSMKCFDAALEQLLALL